MPRIETVSRKRRFGKGPPTLMLRFLFFLIFAVVVIIFAVVALIQWALGLLFAFFAWAIPVALVAAVVAIAFFFIRGFVRGVRKGDASKTVAEG